MTEIFLSYAREDLKKARMFVQAFSERGWETFWDRRTPPGKTWPQVLETELNKAGCVVVLWSEASIKSRWVREEAEEALKRQILVPARIGTVDPPFGFRSVQAADLLEWQGEPDHPDFKYLLDALLALLGEPEPVEAAPAEKRRADEEEKRKEEARLKAEERKRTTAEERELAEAEAKRKAEEEAKRQAEEEARKGGEADTKREVEEDARWTAELEEKTGVAAKAGSGQRASKLPRWGQVGAAKWVGVAALVVLLAGVVWYAGYQVLVGETADRTFKDCPYCPEMVVVPAGSFMMGSPDYEEGRDDDEGPQRRVAISQRFAVGKYEVTFDEWDACEADGGCNGYRPDDRDWGRGGRPVINVSWKDAKAYVAWLSKKAGTAYRLLSEAEWEYAARAGTTTRFSFGDEISTKDANFGSNLGKTSEVGSYPRNPWELHDMHGNAWEWVEDCWNGSYEGAPTDGSAWTQGDCNRRVLRGGSWFNQPRYLRSATRGRVDTDDRFDVFGFRVARTLP